MSDRSTKLKAYLLNALGAVFSPATEGKQDDIIENQTDGTQIAQMYGKTGDATFQVPRIDAMTHTLQIMEYEHHEIHGGSHFYICDYATSDFDLNDTIEFVITTPNTTTWSHMDFYFASSLGATMDVYEGASAVVGGTATTPKNNNRNSETASTLTVLKDPASITDGTQIAGFLGGGNRGSGIVSRDREIILKQNTIYLFRFTSLANSNTIGFCGEWYEHQSRTA